MRKSTLGTRLVAETGKHWAESVAALDIDLFAGVAEEVAKLLSNATGGMAQVAVHGARMGGQALSFADEQRQRGRWVLAEGAGVDHCEDCVAWHGEEMSYSEFLDRKFTSRCNGNCLCEFEPGGEEGGEGPSPLTAAEVEAALGALAEE